MNPPAVRTRAALLPWTLLAGSLAAIAVLGLRLWHPEPAGDPLATSLVAIEREDKLTVFAAELTPVVESEDARLFGMVHSKQVAMIPARVDYSVDLSHVGRDRLAWDPASQTLTLTLPPVRPGRPNLDESRARYLREGIFITRNAQESLTRANSTTAEALASRSATSPVLMDMARAAARDAMSRNMAAALAAAGYPQARIVVKFDT